MAPKKQGLLAIIVPKFIRTDRNYTESSPTGSSADKDRHRLLSLPKELSSIEIHF